MEHTFISTDKNSDLGKGVCKELKKGPGALENRRCLFRFTTPLRLHLSFLIYEGIICVVILISSPLSYRHCRVNSIYNPRMYMPFCCYYGLVPVHYIYHNVLPNQRVAPTHCNHYILYSTYSFFHCRVFCYRYAIHCCHSI